MSQELYDYGDRQIETGLFGNAPKAQGISVSFNERSGHSKNALFTESFDTWPPQGWTITQLGGAAGNWQQSTDTYAGAGSAFHGWAHQSFDSWLVSPAITIPAGEEYMLSFWEKNQYMGSWYDYSGVLISTGSNSPGHENFIEAYESNSSISTYTQKFIDLSAYAGQTIYIAFVYRGNDAHNWWVDEVQISEKRYHYRTRQTGTQNWGTAASWEIFDYNTGNWRNATAADGYPGQNPGTGTVTIQNNHNITLNVSPQHAIENLEFNSGGTSTTLSFQAENSLIILNDLVINTNTSNNRNRSVDIGNGTLTVSDVYVYSDGGTDSRDSFILINNGTLNVSGNVTMNSTGARTYIRFTGNGTLNVGGTITGGNITSNNGGHNTNGPNSGTVNYNHAGDQQVGNYTYHNLAISGGGRKSLQGNTTVSNNFYLTVDCSPWAITTLPLPTTRPMP